jgi:hypothetical protein
MSSQTISRRRRPVHARILVGSIMAVSLAVGLGVASASDAATGVQAATAAMSALTALAALRRPGGRAGHAGHADDADDTDGTDGTHTDIDTADDRTADRE